MRDRVYLSSYDMHEVEINNGLYWTYIPNVMFITYTLMY